MLALRVEFLTGRYVATAFNDRKMPEWPPHPARFFSALFATWAESGQEPLEHDALEWLATLSAPAMWASEASSRASGAWWVPVNDVSTVGVVENSGWLEAERNALIAEDGVVSAQGTKDAKKAAKIRDSALKKATREKSRYDKNVKKSQAVSQASNDSEKELWVMPESRKKQERTFQSVTPEDPCVFFLFDVLDSLDDDASRHTIPLQTLCRKVARLGHSSSLVTCDVVESHPEANLLPADDGKEMLRVPLPDQTSQLEKAYALHQAYKPRIMPSAFQRYRRGSKEESINRSTTVFSDTDWIIFRRLEGHRLPITRSVDLASALRGALLKYATEIPTILSGHDPTGTPSIQAHAAFVALPFVGSEYADGSLLGVALVFPRKITAGDHASVLKAVASWEKQSRRELGDDEVETPPLKLVMGRAGEMTVERVAYGRPLSTLRSETWSKPSRRWRSATPLALDKNPGQLFSAAPSERSAAYREAGEIVALSVQRLGLPPPTHVEILPSVSLVGTEKARAHPRFPRDKSRTTRVKVHVELRFAEPVVGPILLGSGRFRGLGLMRPIGDCE